MNTLDAIITKIIEIRQADDLFYIDVEYDCWGSIGTTTLYTYTLEGAKQITVGDVIVV